jgi:hypothetical protein
MTVSQTNRARLLARIEKLQEHAEEALEAGNIELASQIAGILERAQTLIDAAPKKTSAPKDEDDSEDSEGEDSEGEDNAGDEQQEEADDIDEDGDDLDSETEIEELSEDVRSGEELADDSDDAASLEDDGEDGEDEEEEEHPATLPSKVRKALGEPIADLMDQYLSEVYDHIIGQDGGTLRKALDLGSKEEPTAFRKLVRREAGKVGLRAIRENHADICTAFAKALRAGFDEIMDQFQPEEPEEPEIDESALLGASASDPIVGVDLGDAIALGTISAVAEDFTPSSMTELPPPPGIRFRVKG